MKSVKLFPGAYAFDNFIKGEFLTEKIKKSVQVIASKSWISRNNRVVAVCTAGQMLTAIQFLEIFKRDIAAVTRRDVEA